MAIAQTYKEIVHDSAELNDILTDNDGHPREEYKAGWNNKMFTRADLMIHHIKITDVRLERLQKISDDDIRREGICKSIYESPTFPYHFYEKTTESNWWFQTPSEAYSTLIDKISGKGTWGRNPWVVVYEFEKVD